MSRAGIASALHKLEKPWHIPSILLPQDMKRSPAGLRNIPVPCSRVPCEKEASYKLLRTSVELV